MVSTKKVPNSKYMTSDICHLINDAIQNKLFNLPATLTEIKDTVKG